MTEPAGLTVVVLALDEEALIERVVNSCSFADEVLVVDSGSTDRTRELARAAGARVIEQPWLGWSAQRNAGIDAARHDWILVVECDEIVTVRLRTSIREVLTADPSPSDGWFLVRRDEVLGRLMPEERRRGRAAALVRLFNRTESRYDTSQLVHEQVLVPGATHGLAGILLHWRGESFADLLAVVVRYGDVEARALLADGVRARTVDLVVRPPLRFLWCYVRKGGLQRGRHGLVWALLRSAAEGLRWARLAELQRDRFD